MQHPYCNFCLQERSTSRWGAIQRADHVSLQDHGRCVVPSLGAGEVGGKQDQRSARSDRGDRDERSSQRGSKDSGSRNRGRFQYRPQEKEEGMSVSTWPDISHLSISKPELVNALRQMGQQVKWPPKMKAPDSFRNPGLWCDFHRDHGHKTEDCISTRIKAKAHLSKETTGEIQRRCTSLTTSPRSGDPCHIGGSKKRSKPRSGKEKHP
uniref:Uncharacterized protein n=1 Tax=Brassica oleracea TaxID=3712 RepID=A0A3P6EP05_BRAOL|nr:unnamed protein product [Brassica oleracea]